MKLISQKLSRRSEWRELWKKTHCKSFREVRSNYFSTLSDTIHPEKNSRLFPASFSSQLSITQQHPTWCTNTDDMPHTSHLASKTALVPTRRHTTTDHRREQRGALGCLGCFLPLLACPGGMRAGTSVALTCPSDTHRSLSMGFPISSRQQHQHSDLSLPRSVFRG